jgi:hypothetical protein
MIIFCACRFAIKTSVQWSFFLQTKYLLAICSEIMVLEITENKCRLMFCWPCVVVYQCSETNVMHFLYSVC